MSLLLKGVRGVPNGYTSPNRIAKEGGQIWAEGPQSALEQGLSIVMAPDLSHVIDGDAAGRRAAGANDGVTVGNEIGFLTEGSAAGTSEVFQSVGGRLVMTNNAADNDYLTLCFQGGGSIATPSMRRLPFLPLANTKLRFGIRCKVSDATQSDFVLGLTPSEADAVAGVTDGIFITKGDGFTQPGVALVKNSATTLLALTDEDGVAIAVENDTYFEAGFVVNGLTSVDIYWNGHHVRQSTVTNLDDDEPLTITLQIQNGEAAAKTLTVERLLARQDMV